MARPCKGRNIENNPCYTCFQPEEILDTTQNIVLKLDEYEAIRLTDLNDLSNISGAEKMWISSPTFNRLVKSAHKKITDAIVNWKIITIEKCDKL